VPRGKAIWNPNGGFVSVLLTHLLLFELQIYKCVQLNFILLSSM